MLYATASQTVGPYLHIGLTGLNCADLTADAPELADQRIVITGRVTDGLGAVVPDALLEFWQANPAGRYCHPDDKRDLPLVQGFTGFGRVPTGPDGSFRIVTVKPGPVPDDAGRQQAAHLLVSVFARGLVRHVATRMYFPEEQKANALDSVLGLVPPERRSTLVAQPQSDGTLRWNVVLQGAAETVFFDV